MLSVRAGLFSSLAKAAQNTLPLCDLIGKIMKKKLIIIEIQGYNARLRPREKFIFLEKEKKK